MDTPKTGALEGFEAAGAASAESAEITALVDRAKQGDAGAFDSLMRTYERRIILLGVQMGLSREDALDTSQETFIKVFRYIHRFRSGESFFKWLYRIAIHVIYDHLRKARSARSVALDDLGPEEVLRLPDAPPSLERRVEAADLKAKLLAGLGSLSRQERIVFTLRDLQQMSTEEIGTILRLSQITVRRHCASARQKLRQRLFPAGLERSDE